MSATARHFKRIFRRWVLSALIYSNLAARQLITRDEWLLNPDPLRARLLARIIYPFRSPLYNRAIRAVIAPRYTVVCTAEW